MALKIILKPHEKIFIGGAVVQNGDGATELSVLNDIPLLRGKDVLTEENADTKCKQLYLCVQLMYMDRLNLANYQQTYRDLMRELLTILPDSVTFIAEINNDLACGHYYRAMKCARKLVEYEEELIKHAQ
jgi:flagellar protein FlbT